MSDNITNDSSKKIKAIIFDCFGVLASDGFLPFRDKYIAKDPVLLKKAIELNKKVDAARIDYNDFIRQVAMFAGVNEDDARREIENNVPDPELFSYISSNLKPNYKIGMLSNAGVNWLDKIFLPEQVELFDAITLLCETGIIKPDIAAYQIIADKLGLKTSECIFIDDQLKYCQGAIKAGMVVIQYTGLAQLKVELASML